MPGDCVTVRPMMMRSTWIALALAAPLCLFSTGCTEDGDTDEHMDETGHDDHGHDDHGHGPGETEVITRVELTFTPDGGGDPIVAAFSDPDGDGGESGMSDPITLAANTSYSLAVTFANELVDPAEDITPEVEDEPEDHQVFFGGDAVGGLLTHTYADMESTYGANASGEDLPVGLANTIAAGDAGTGSLTVQLQHMPAVNGEPVKVPGLAEMFPSVPGEPDTSVTFAVTVQ